MIAIIIAIGSLFISGMPIYQCLSNGQIYPSDSLFPSEDRYPT